MKFFSIFILLLKIIHLLGNLEIPLIIKKEVTFKRQLKHLTSKENKLELLEKRFSLNNYLIKAKIMKKSYLLYLEADSSKVILPNTKIMQSKEFKDKIVIIEKKNLKNVPIIISKEKKLKRGKFGLNIFGKFNKKNEVSIDFNRKKLFSFKKLNKEKQQKINLNNLNGLLKYNDDNFLQLNQMKIDLSNPFFLSLNKDLSIIIKKHFEEKYNLKCKEKRILICSAKNSIKIKNLGFTLKLDKKLFFMGKIIRIVKIGKKLAIFFPIELNSKNNELGILFLKNFRKNVFNLKEGTLSLFEKKERIKENMSEKEILKKSNEEEEINTAEMGKSSKIGLYFLFGILIFGLIVILCIVKNFSGNSVYVAPHLNKTSSLEGKSTNKEYFSNDSQREFVWKVENAEDQVKEVKIKLKPKIFN